MVRRSWCGAGGAALVVRRWWCGAAGAALVVRRCWCGGGLVFGGRATETVSCAHRPPLEAETIEEVIQHSNLFSFSILKLSLIRAQVFRRDRVRVVSGVLSEQIVLIWHVRLEWLGMLHCSGCCLLILKSSWWQS